MPKDSGLTAELEGKGVKIAASKDAKEGTYPIKVKDAKGKEAIVKVNVKKNGTQPEERPNHVHSIEPYGNCTSQLPLFWHYTAAARRFASRPRPANPATKMRRRPRYTIISTNTTIRAAHPEVRLTGPLRRAKFQTLSAPFPTPRRR